MSVVAVIVDGPVTPDVESAALMWHAAGSPAQSRAEVDGRVGAGLRFEGIVRRLERSAEPGGAERELVGLEYQTYDPMAQREMESLARSVLEKHGLLSIVALHSRGRVAVGETSFVLTVSAAHRAEAIAAIAEFIDRLKRDVPIWKRAVWPG